MKRLLIDFETRSEADLKKVGGVKYAKHATTEVICVAYKIDDGETKLIGYLEREGNAFTYELEEALNNPNVLIEAHNALFEYSILKYTWKKDVDIARFSCTAARAAACGLPRKLEGACLALDLPIQKDMRGNKLMLKYSKPRPVWSKWKREGMVGTEPKKWFDDQFEIWEIYDYCKTDIEAEDLLSKAIPQLTPSERESWLLNQRSNLNGVLVDVDTARRIIRLAGEKSKSLERQLAKITGGAVTSAMQRDRMLAWLKSQGVKMPVLTADAVRDTIPMLSPSPARKVLQIRKALSKSSVKKYQALITRADEDDNRVKDISMWHGAHTGREAGRGLQLQNLPRGTIKDTAFAIDHVIRGGTLDEIELIYGDSFEAFSSVIRGMIISSPGSKLYVADFNAIEARVLAWVAGDEAGLKVFRDGLDPYKAMASIIFRTPIEKVTSEQRFVGKTAILGLGYGMGADKFLATCHQQGGKFVTGELAKKTVDTFRTTKPSIPKLWALAERAAILAVKMPGQWFGARSVAYIVRDGFLEARLPSGRSIRYHAPTVRAVDTPWGDRRDALFYWHVDSYTKKWSCTSSYGGLLVENLVQGIARDLMVEASKRVVKHGYEYLFSVHDEIVSESPSGNIEEYERLISETPPWADGLPVVAKGFMAERYRK